MAKLICSECGEEITTEEYLKLHHINLCWECVKLHTEDTPPQEEYESDMAREAMLNKSDDAWHDR